MKLLGRIVVLLALALVVVGGLLLFNGSDWAAGVTPAGPERPAMTQGEEGALPTELDRSAPPDMAGLRPTGLEGRKPPEGGAPGGLMVMEFLKNLVIMAGMVAVFNLILWLWKRLPFARHHRSVAAVTAKS